MSRTPLAQTLPFPPQPTSNTSEENMSLSSSSMDAPYAIKQSRSISPNLKPPSLDLPSVGYLVSTKRGPLALACILSNTICFSF